MPRLVRLSDLKSESAAQEIIVETSDHSLSTALLPEPQLFAVLCAAKIRYEELSRDPRFAHISLGKKHGRGAGAVFDHAHWLLSATGTIPAQVLDWMQHARRHFGKSGTCIFCTVLEEEFQSQQRIVMSGEHFIALEPYASPAPFCTHIFPRRHMASFAEIDSEETEDLARILHGVLARFHHGLEDPDFVCALRTTPLANKGVKYYHWSLCLVPRLIQPENAASGKNALLNSVLPETAAEFLRSVRIEQAIPA